MVMVQGIKNDEEQSNLLDMHNGTCKEEEEQKETTMKRWFQGLLNSNLTPSDP